MVQQYKVLFVFQAKPFPICWNKILNDWNHPGYTKLYIQKVKIPLNLLLLNRGLILNGAIASKSLIMSVLYWVSDRFSILQIIFLKNLYQQLFKNVLKK